MFAVSTVIKQNTAVGEMVRVIVGAIFLFACAQMSIPLEPVPISLQTMGLMIIALLYNMPTGIASVVAYLTAGALGAPVFTGYSAGAHVLVGTTGGYLVGFVACVYVMNKLKAVLSPQTAAGIFLNCIAGTVVVFIFGISWLSVYVGWQGAITHGLLPFIVPGLLKAIILTLFLRSLGIVRVKCK